MHRLGCSSPMDPTMPSLRARERTGKVTFRAHVSRASRSLFLIHRARLFSRAAVPCLTRTVIHIQRAGDA